MRLCTCKIVHKHKKAFFIGKVKSRCFCWFSAAILVSHVGTRTRRLHTKLKKKLRGTFWKITKTVRSTDLRLVHLWVFCIISISWLLQWKGLKFIFSLCDSENTLQSVFTWSQVRHIDILKQWNGGHVGVPNQSYESWIIFLPKYTENVPLARWVGTLY